MAGSFTPTASYTNLTRLELEQLRKADFYAGSKALTLGDAGNLGISGVGPGNINAEPYLTGPNVLLDEVYSLTPTPTPGMYLGTLTQTAGFPSETVRWFGPDYVYDALGGDASGIGEWRDIETPGLDFTLFVQPNDLLLIKEITTTGSGSNVAAVATITARTATTLTLSNIIAPAGAPTNQLTIDGFHYAYVIVRPSAVQLFAVPGSGPTGREQTFLAVVPGSTLHTNLAPTLNQINADRVTSIVPSQYTRDTDIDRADGVYGSPAPRVALDKLGYRVVLYPSNLAGTGPDLSKPIVSLNPVIDSTIPAGDQRMTIDNKAGVIRFSCAPLSGADLNPNGVVNTTTGRLDLYAVFWAVDQSLTLGNARGLWASRSTINTPYAAGKIRFDTTENAWLLGSTASGNEAYARALGSTEDADLTTEIGAFDPSSSTFFRRYLAYRPLVTNSKPGGLNPTGRWRALHQDTNFPGIDPIFSVEQELADRTKTTVGDIGSPPPAGSDMAPEAAFLGFGMQGARDTQTTLETALRVAAMNGYSTVKLKKGRYYVNSPLVIPPGVTLEGEGPGTVIESRIKPLTTLTPYTSPVFKIGPNSRFGTYNPNWGGTYEGGTFIPKKLTMPLADTRLEGMDIVWNPVRRVWGMVWADLSTNTVFFNEVATDGTLTFPGLGIDIKNSATALFSALSANSQNHTAGHYPRLAYHEFSDQYAVVWVEEYNPGGGVGPRVALQAFNVQLYPLDPITGAVAAPTLTNVFVATQFLTGPITGTWNYFTHPSITFDTSSIATNPTIYIVCWTYGDTTLANTGWFFWTQECSNGGFTTYNPLATFSPSVISSTDIAADGQGGFLAARSRRRHPLYLSTTGKIRISGVTVGSYSWLEDPAYPNWNSVGVDVGTKFIPLGPSAMDDTSRSSFFPVFSASGSSGGANTLTDATVDFLALGVRAGDMLIDPADTLVTHITNVAQHVLTTVDVIPAGAGKPYYVYGVPGFASNEMLLKYGVLSITQLAAMDAHGDGVVFDTISAAAEARIRPLDRLGVYFPSSQYLKWSGSGSAPGGGYTVTDATGYTLDFTTMGINVGDILQVGFFFAPASCVYGYVSAVTANTISIDPATATSAIPATAGIGIAVTTGNLSYAMVPPSYVESIRFIPGLGFAGMQRLAGVETSSVGYVLANREPDFVRLSRGDADWICVYQSFNTTGYFSRDSNVNWDGGDTNSSWIDTPASKHLRYLDHSAVYRTHVSTCAIILDDSGKLYNPDPEGMQLTPDVQTFLERMTRSFEVSNRSLGVQDPITINTGYSSENGFQIIRLPHQFAMQVSPINFTYRWTPSKSMSLIPDVTWSGSDWSVVSPAKKQIHSVVGNYIVTGTGAAGEVYLGDLTFMFGVGASNPVDSTYLRKTVMVGDVIYFASNGTYGTISAVHNEHIVQLTEADASLLAAGAGARLANVEWALIREQLDVPAGIKNPGFRVTADGKVIVSSSFNTFADEPLDNSELPGALVPEYPRTQLMRRIYDDAFYNNNSDFDGMNLPASLAEDALTPESRYVADIGFKGVVVGEPKGCNEKVLDEPPIAAIAWGENLYGFIDHVVAGRGTTTNDVRFYRQSFGPYNAGLKDMRIIGRSVPHYVNANTARELKLLSRKQIGTRHGPPTGAMGFFATDGYRNVFPRAVAKTGVLESERMRTTFVYTNAIGANPLEVYGPPPVIEIGSFQNDIGLYLSSGAAGSTANFNSLVSAPKIIWDGKQFVAAWSEGGSTGQEQLVCLALLPGSEDQRTVTGESVDPSDRMPTRIAALRSVENRSSNAVVPSSIVALDIAYSGSSYAVLWIAGLNLSGWRNFGTFGTMTPMVGVTIFEETGFSGGIGDAAALESPAVFVDVLISLGRGWFVAETWASETKSPLPQIGDSVILAAGGPVDGSRLGRYTVIDVDNSTDGLPNCVRLDPEPIASIVTGTMTSNGTTTIEDLTQDFVALGVQVNDIVLAGAGCAEKGTYRVTVVAPGAVNSKLTVAKWNVGIVTPTASTITAGTWDYSVMSHTNTAVVAGFYRAAKGSGGITHILDINASGGEALSHPNIVWNGKSFLAMWRQAPTNVAAVPDVWLDTIAYTHVPEKGFSDPLHIKWLGGGNEPRDTVSTIRDSHIGSFASNAAASTPLFLPQNVSSYAASPTGLLPGAPPYLTRGDTLVITKTTGHAIAFAAATGKGHGTRNFTDPTAPFGAVAVGDILWVRSGVSAPYLGFYKITSIAGAPGSIQVDRIIENTGAGSAPYSIAAGTPTVWHDNDGWYQVETAVYDGLSPFVTVNNKTWLLTTGYADVRVYGMVMSGGYNDSRSLPTNVPYTAGSNMAPKVITESFTGTTDGTEQGHALRYLAQLYGMAYNPVNDEYCVLFKTYNAHLVAVTVRASTMEMTNEVTVYAGAPACMTADIAWNGRHYMVVYATDGATSTQSAYKLLTPNLAVQETQTITLNGDITGNSNGHAPGHPSDALHLGFEIIPRIRNVQVRWNDRLNRWVVGTSVLWSRDRGVDGDDDTMPSGWPLSSTTVTAVNGNVLTLSGTTDINLVQVGLKLGILNTSSQPQAIFSILSVNPTGPNPTITLDSAYPQNPNTTAPNRIQDLAAGHLWVYPREDTWCYTIGYDQPILQLEDADGAFVEGVTFDGMIDIEEKYPRMASPIRQSGGSLVGWPEWVYVSPLSDSFFDRQPYNHALLTPAAKVSMATFTNMRSNTKVKYGYGSSLSRPPDRSTFLSGGRRKG